MPGLSKPVLAVLDTNILVAFALRGATPDPAWTRRSDAIHQCVTRVRADHGLLGTPATMAELRSVLMRPDFERYAPAEQRERFLDAITAETTMVVPGNAHGLCRDPDDDMFLAAALGGGADWLITVDRQLLSVRRIGHARILRPERFLEALG